MKAGGVLKKFISFFSVEIVTFLFLTAVSLFALVKFANLTPRVDENFFFSTDDPQFKQEKRISALFARKDTQLVISAKGDIGSPEYLEKIKILTGRIASAPGVINVLSLSSGPGDLRSARSGPLWQRLLIAKNNDATNIIVIVEGTMIKDAIKAIEPIINESDKKDFQLLISGAPYIVELIERNLVRDFKTFSFMAFVMFAVIILFIFQSIRILIGTMVSCLAAGSLTLVITDILNIQIGLLTANIATIVFVLTLSHIVYLTYNWKHLHDGSGIIAGKITHQAVLMTFSPSFWSMVTTALGFLTLLTVPAKPLQELGISGTIGCLVSISIVYTMYPAFLKRIEHFYHEEDVFERAEDIVYRRIKGRKQLVATFLIILGILFASGLTLIRHDPSIFSYFRKRSEIARGLKIIDRQGGSSPLIIIIRSSDRSRLNTNEMFERMWKLQLVLERHDSVGTLISLPVLMAQVRQTPFSFFLSWEWLFEIMETPDFQEISKSFITEDRRHGLFLFRMKEFGRQEARLAVVDELKQIIREYGFIPEMVGGIYALQGRMSHLVAVSMINGLSRLAILFFFIGWSIARSLRTGFAMVGSLSVVPVIVLGIVGLVQLPFDVIAAPAINIAISIGIDAMIHMVKYFQRVRSECRSSQSTWERTRSHLWKPVINSVLVIFFGFGIFFFSRFPPTQRFGAIIVIGAVFSGLSALFLLPWVATIGNKKLSVRAR
ncbi:MAG: MMPL family transporter [Candidatus Omnitrophota bacterium]